VLCFLWKESLVPNGYEAGWAPELVWLLWSREKSFAPAGNQTPAIQAISHLYLLNYTGSYIKNNMRDAGCFCGVKN
jgi:hypothetical protein